MQIVYKDYMNRVQTLEIPFSKTELGPSYLDIVYDCIADHENYRPFVFLRIDTK